jgi:hypothetical protein
LKGVITDPRNLAIPYPRVSDPESSVLNTEMLLPPLPPDEARRVQLFKGPNTAFHPELEPLADRLDLTVSLIVVAKGFARIHWQNLVNFGILPLTLEDPSEYDRIGQRDVPHFGNLPGQIRQRRIVAENTTSNRRFPCLRERGSE